MTIPQQDAAQENKPSDKELNFRALEQRYQRQLEQERAARMAAEQQVQEANSRRSNEEVDEDDDEPYVAPKKLQKTLSAFEKKMEDRIDKKAEEKAKSMMDKERKDSWLRSNPDFYDVLQHADKFADRDPDLAESILQMPEGFERQKLVYKNIKALGIHKPEVKAQTIQEKIDANRKSPYYQPNGMASAPYAGAGDFSASGQKNAYDKMQELKSRLRI